MSKINKSGFAWPLVLVGVAVLIIAAGTIAYFLLKPKPLIQSQPTTTPTSELPIQDKQPGGTFSVDPSAEANTKNWKVYKNSRTGFSVKYPENWLINDCGGVDISFGPSVQLLGACESDAAGVVSIQASLEVDYDERIEGFDPADFDNVLTQKTIISGKKAVKSSGTAKQGAFFPEGTKMIVYTLNFNGKALIISYWQLPTWGDYSETFELMVSTFKFLD